MDVTTLLTGAARRASLEARSLVVLTRAGGLGWEPPRTMLEMASVLRAFGPLGASARIAALRHGDYPAIADDRGELTFAELDRQVNRAASALRRHGVTGGVSIGILCRNHRQPLIVAFAASRLGANTIWLNTAFSARQAQEVAEREGVEFLVYDDEFAEVVAPLTPAHGKVMTAIDRPDDDELDRLIAHGSVEMPEAPAKPGRVVLLTSGTTGTPKGAPRADPRSLTIPGALLERMPMRARETTVVAPPLYHATGLALALVSIALGSKLVLRRRFEPAQFLDDIERHRATGVCVVPIMLQRVLALGEDEIRRRDLGSLRVVFCAGSQLPAAVAIQAMDVLGDVVYNLYGSTEVSVATLATPQDIRAAPTSVGKPALGATVKLLDDAGREVPQGQTGRIFVGSVSPFEGYTGGGHKEVIDGLMSTGDVGHFDADGRLYVDGRDDEMIVSGGENVFPREVEELLIDHPAIADVAVIGVDDEEFGKRLRAFIVTAEGQQITEAEVKAYVKDNLARYKAPRDVITLDELPRNPTGKVLKRELANWTG